MIIEELGLNDILIIMKTILRNHTTVIIIMMMINMMIIMISRMIMYDEADEFIARTKYVEIEDDDGDTLYVRSSKEIIHTKMKTTEVIITGHTLYVQSATQNTLVEAYVLYYASDLHK